MRKLILSLVNRSVQYELDNRKDIRDAVKLVVLFTIGISFCYTLIAHFDVSLGHERG